MPARRNFFDAKILVIDDQEAQVRLVESILKGAGYTRVHSLTDPRLAMRHYSDIQPDLVMLDLNMPYLNGFQVMQQFAAIEGSDWIPVLVVSGEDEGEVLIRALQGGAQDFVAKPFDRTEILTRIRNMLEVRMLHNEVKDQNRLLEERVRERTVELRETQLDVVHRLGRCAEYRDDVTGNHIHRVSRFCERLGHASGMTPQEAEILRDASTMHDVGKVGIPDSILRKPGKLTPDEWEIMKSHTVIGAGMLAGGRSDLLQTAEKIAMFHHERWDGSGYPMGMRGTDIPMVGRITSVCDVFDALTSERSYKVAWTPEAARAEIERQSGTQFDPDVVKLFIGIWPDILRIREHYLDPATPRGFK